MMGPVDPVIRRTSMEQPLCELLTGASESDPRKRAWKLSVS